MHRKKKPRFIQEIVKWHRTVGMISAFFVLLLALTGMLLNHTDVLELSQRYVHSSLLQGWYGLAAPAVQKSFPVGDAWVTQLEDRLYYNEHELGGHYASLQGAIGMGDNVAVALANGVLLLDRQGNIVEEAHALRGLPTLQAIGEWHGRAVVQGEGQQLVADPELLKWLPIDLKPVQWSRATTPPEALGLALRKLYQNKMLNTERVVRDIHNGRILGRWGAWFMDGMALAFIGMALTGVWMWWQRRNGLQEEKKRARKSPH